MYRTSTRQLCQARRFLTTSASRSSFLLPRLYSSQPAPKIKESTPPSSSPKTPIRDDAHPPRPTTTLPPAPEPYADGRVPLGKDAFLGLSGGQIFHEMMLRHRVRHVFGYPGGAILPVFDAIHNSKHFNFVLPRHEQGAGHMAEGYARATGKPGVVLVTSGPGATNVVTAMQDALMDGTPLVVFSGQVVTNALGTDAFQEADVLGISRPCTKWNVMVRDIRDLPRRIDEAFEVATSGRPGPVLVDLPKDITAAILTKPIVPPSLPSRIRRTSFPALSSPSSSSSSSPPSSSGVSLGRHLQEVENDAVRSQIAAINRVASLINNAKRPVIYAGQGILQTQNGPELLKELADRGNIPVTTTLMGLGAFDELDPKSLHMLGMHGTPYANKAVQEADVLLALGARFDDRVTGLLSKFAPGAKLAAKEGRGGIVQFDILPKNINKIVQVDEAIEGDVGASLRLILPMIQSVQRPEWFSRIKEWKDSNPISPPPPTNPFVSAGQGGAPTILRPQDVLTELNRHLQMKHAGKDEVIITTGVGQHQMWAAQHIRWRSPRSFITSGGLGTMGFGLPAAIGAKVACPHKTVIDIDGDASFSMTAMELATAGQYGIGVKVLILNNEFQGMVKQWQDLFYEERYSSTQMKNPNFVALAEACGCKGLRVRDPADLPAAISLFLSWDQGPIVLDVLVDKKEHVYPMVPAGKGLHEMVLTAPSKEPTGSKP
ncbi:MAG: thiamine diphosphate-binding protein [Piptocephalis tieghemiana]|nr:MAG: thiamine diphosphate-binding protein [Piptocephalis tieghemiana]